MTRIPDISHKHKICVICEGYEDESYFKRLIDLNVWDDSYEFHVVNAKSESNIPARFQDLYQNDRYDIILILCDTDKAHYTKYEEVKKKINDFLG